MSQPEGVSRTPGAFTGVHPLPEVRRRMGYSSRTTIRFIFNHSFPREFLRWYLATGALWKSVIFQEWLRTKSTLMWSDVAKRLKAQFDPEMLKRVKQAGLQYSLCGGFRQPQPFRMVYCRHVVRTEWQGPSQTLRINCSVAGPGEPACLSAHAPHET